VEIRVSISIVGGLEVGTLNLTWLRHILSLPGRGTFDGEVVALAGNASLLHKLDRLLRLRQVLLGLVVLPRVENDVDLWSTASAIRDL